MSATAVYDSIGLGYDATRRADPGIAAQLHALLQPRPAGRYLDLACGTGNYTRALADHGLNMTGVDLSRRMLGEAAGKAAHVRWHLGDATALPFRDGVFDGVVCTNAIHHFPALGPAFREAYRVMDAGRLVLFTSTPEQMRDYWLNAYFPVAMRRGAAVMSTGEMILAALTDAGFTRIAREPYVVSPELQDLFLYCGKQRPVLYFDPTVRAGISLFAQFGLPAEVERGCTALLDDLHTGRFADVAAEFTSGMGDYMFIVAEKAAR